MTQEDKNILLKDLCARLPYNTNIQVKDWAVLDAELEIGHINRLQNDNLELKPYLRPMSSMTEEEKMQLKEEHLKDARLFAEALTKAAAGDTSMRGKVIPHFAADWCNKNHFDFRGLIEKGLALEAPEGMYKT